MPIIVTCTCGKKLRAKDEHAGKRTKCPVCGTAIDIPSVRQEVGKKAAKLPFLRGGRQEAAEAYAEKGMRIGTAIASPIVLLVLIGAVRATMAFYGFGLVLSILYVVLAILLFPTVIGEVILAYIVSLISPAGFLTALFNAVQIVLIFVGSVLVVMFVGSLPGRVIGEWIGKKKKKK